MGRATVIGTEIQLTPEQHYRAACRWASEAMGRYESTQAALRTIEPNKLYWYVNDSGALRVLKSFETVKATAKQYRITYLGDTFIAPRADLDQQGYGRSGWRDVAFGWYLKPFLEEQLSQQATYVARALQEAAGYQGTTPAEVRADILRQQEEQRTALERM
jgi:hypothetical protein